MLSAATVDAINYQVNAAFRPCAEARSVVAAHGCTTDFHPGLAGDCKQVAAEKLLRLLLAGARPGDFTIWIVRVPAGLHAVLVENATGRVLDNLIGQIEPRALKARHEGMDFLNPCEACGEAAQQAALTGDH